MRSVTRAGVACGAFAAVAGGCGSSHPAAVDGGVDSRVGVVASCPGDLAGIPAATDDVLAGVPCVAWRPSDEDWSSLPTAPVVPNFAGHDLYYGPSYWTTLMPSSPGGRYLYAVGAWLDAAAPRRQIVRSADLGASWCVLATPQDVSMVMAAPAAPLLLYALTAADASGAVGTGLLRSTDGGATWEDRPGGLPVGAAPSLPPPTVFVAGDGQTIWIMGTSAFYLSRDGGGSWTEVPYPVRDAAFVGLTVDPRMPARLLAPGGGSGTLASEDWGTTWSDVSLPGALVGVDAFSSLYATDEDSLWRSCDWGKTWAVTGRVPPPGSAVSEVVVSPLGARRPEELFQVSLDVFNLTAVARTTDAGATWTAVPLPAAASMLLPAGGGERLVARTASGLASSSPTGAWVAGPSVLDAASDLVASPVDPLTLWAPSGSFLYRSRDGAASFAATALALAYGGRVDRPLVDGLSADVAYASHMRTEDGGATWQSVDTFDWLDACAPPRSCLRGWPAPGPDGWRRLRISVDHGTSWADLVPLSGLPTLGPIAGAPDDDSRFLAGGRMVIHETDDGGHTWTLHPIGGNAEIDVADIVYASSDTALALATSFGLGGTIYRTVDGGQSWTAFATVPFAVGKTARLRRSAAHPATWFVLPGDGQTPVHRSDDDAATWAPETMAAIAVVGGPDGGYLAQIPGYGLVHFR